MPYGVQPPRHNMNDHSAFDLLVFHMQNVIAPQPPPPLNPGSAPAPPSLPLPPPSSPFSSPSPLLPSHSPFLPLSLSPSPPPFPFLSPLPLLPSPLLLPLY